MILRYDRIAFRLRGPGSHRYLWLLSAAGQSRSESRVDDGQDRQSE
jgi:hypothetical protein